MTEESDEKESAAPEKLLIDNPSDFQFHAAYLAYSDAYDKTADPEIKRQLNQNIEALRQNQMDYPTFYRNINQYRMDDASRYLYNRALIKTQRKREWRINAEKRERDRRHKK
jgi:hypothetical protein